MIDNWGSSYLLGFFLILFSACSLPKQVYIDTADPTYIMETVRQKIGKYDYIEKSTFTYKGANYRMEVDSIRIVGNNWYKKFRGEYQLYLGEKAFMMDSIDVYNNFIDSLALPIITYPFHTIYFPSEKVVVSPKDTVYIFNFSFFYDGTEWNSGSVFFDPKVGIVEEWTIWADKTILKDYKYRDMLSKGAVIKK